MLRTYYKTETKPVETPVKVEKEVKAEPKKTAPVKKQTTGAKKQ